MKKNYQKKGVAYFWLWVLLVQGLALIACTSAKAQNLSNPNATKEAVALYRYIKDMYGKRILSGQMDSPWGVDELAYIQLHTGKQPAIRGLDYMHESDNNAETQRAIDWWRKGGIPTIMWHWGAPSKGEGYQASLLSIDINRCFQQGTAEYQSFWYELDRKADQLEKLKNANVPVLWRPYHELNGNWFWWGKGGPEQFKRLWITMYDYFVKERKLDNLIWVLCYTGDPDGSWFPGRQYVDIAGADTYASGTGPQLSMYNDAKNSIGGNQIPISYHECGTPPNPDQCLSQGAMWSWWMEWHTGHLEGVDRNYLRTVYNHNLVITLDEVPNIMAVYGDGTPTTNCGIASNGYPVCCNASSDPDGDGWGWENNQSCYVVANIAPAVSIIAPAANSSFTAPASFTITANATDSDGTISKVEFYNGTVKLGEDLTAPYSLAVSGLAAATYSLTARATDNRGAVKTSGAVAITVRVNAQCGIASNGYPVCCNASSDPDGDGWGWENNQSCYVVANVAPAVSITAPAANSSFTAPASFTITAHATDSDGTISKVEFYNGTVKLGEDLTAPYSLAVNGLAAATYSFTARATDNRGAVKTSSAVSITVRTSSTCGVASNGYPICCNPSSDPDGDGWGWENNQSCYVVPTVQPGVGFKISGTQLRDANGNNFIMKGMNVPLSWFVNDVNSNIASIRSRTNANCLRIVVTTSTPDAAWQTCVERCIANQMIPMVELHDVTGSNSASDLQRMGNWWASKASFLTRPAIARYILINIANEWGDWYMASPTNDPSGTVWRDAYIGAIRSMRNAGIQTTIVVDAPGYGQDNKVNTLLTYGPAVQAADPQHNILFSVHMYCEWRVNGNSSITTHLPAIKNAGLPVIVGEFGFQHSEGSGTCDINESQIISTCQSNGIGWLAWSWKGNGSGVQYLDLSNDWAGTSLSGWGNTVVNGANGTKTAVTCSVFTNSLSASSSAALSENLAVLGENPTEGDFVLSLNEEVAALSVSDAYGTEVYATGALESGSTVMFGSGFRSGTYFLRIYYFNGSSEVKRIQKL